jgi:GT2 family glycosyltransferase
VVPVHNGRGWLPACLAALEGQGFCEVVVVDDASTDGTAGWLVAEHPEIRVVPFGGGGLASGTRPRRKAARGPLGFAEAAQAGIDAATGDAVALVNADVELAPGWLGATAAALGADAGCGAVACKLVRRADPGTIDDAGDVLRRDGVCEQRGRLRADDGRWDRPGAVWGACAGAALYRATALREAGGFAPVYRNYLEDVDLALALRSAGWRCAYVPAVARHAGGGSAAALPAPVRYWVARNTLVLVARWFPVRWWPLVAYRQASWLVAAARDGVLGFHLRGLAAGVVAGVREWPGRRERRSRSRVPIAEAVPARPWRGTAAGGHPAGVE